MVLKNLFIGQQWRNRHREQTYGHGEREGECEMDGRGTWKLTLPYALSDSVRPHRRQPTRLPRPWDSPGKNTGVNIRVHIFFLNYVFFPKYMPRSGTTGSHGSSIFSVF